MVTVPRWKIPVSDEADERSQLELDPISGGRLQFRPPPGETFTMTVDQLPALVGQVMAGQRLLEDAMSNAETARQVQAAGQ